MSGEKTNREECFHCGAILRWYYKTPKFCFKCKRNLTSGETVMPGWELADCVVKYLPLLEGIIDKVNGDAVYCMNWDGGTLFSIFSYGKVVKFAFSPEELSRQEMTRIFQHFRERLCD